MREVNGKHVQHLHGLLDVIDGDLDVEGVEDGDVARKKLKQVQRALDALEKMDDPDEAAKSPFAMRIKQFVEKADDATTIVGTAIRALESGAEHVAAIKRHWAKIAPWLGMAGGAAGHVM